VASEVLRVPVQAKLVVQTLHVGLGGVKVLPGLGVIFPEVLHVDEEVPEATLLEHTCKYIQIFTLVYLMYHIGQFWE